MKKNLRNIGSIFLYHFIDKRKILGAHSNLTGDHSGLIGDCTLLTGDASNLTGNCTNISGNCSLISGDIDQCDINDSDRYNVIPISDLVMDE